MRETKGIDNEVRTKALAECLKRKLYSATDFGDIIAYVKRQRQVHETVIDKKKEVKTLNRLSEWVLETEAYKRKVDTYTVLMEVE